MHKISQGTFAFSQQLEALRHLQEKLQLNCVGIVMGANGNHGMTGNRDLEYQKQ